MPTSQNTWSPSTSHQTTHSAPPPPYHTGSLNSSKPGEEPTTPWLKRHAPSSTPPPTQRWSDMVVTTNAAPSLKSNDAPSPLRSRKKITRFRGLNIVWKHTGSTKGSPPWKDEWTSAATSPPAASSCAAQTLAATAAVDQEVLPEREVMLPPEYMPKLLPWYMQWSRDLADEMHRRRLVRNEAHCTELSPSAYRPCDCTSEWQCKPHDACFIHDSCFCPGSSSF